MFLARGKVRGLCLFRQAGCDFVEEFLAVVFNHGGFILRERTLYSTCRKNVLTDRGEGFDFPGESCINPTLSASRMTPPECEAMKEGILP